MSAGVLFSGVPRLHLAGRRCRQCYGNRLGPDSGDLLASPNRRFMTLPAAAEMPHPGRGVRPSQSAGFACGQMVRGGGGGANPGDFAMSDTPQDTLRLNEQQIREMIELLDKRGAREAGVVKRFNRRFGYGASAAVIVELQQPTGDSLTYRVVAHDLSSTGVGFLHGVFVHSGVPCTVELIALDRERIRVPGTVVRCELVKGRVHFVGVRFDQSIDLSMFVCADDEPVSTPHTTSKDTPRADSAQTVKRLLGELVAHCAAKDCPPAVRKIAGQLVESYNDLLKRAG